MTKLVYFISMAVPQQVKFCMALQQYFDAEFWFYERLADRADWWKIELPEKCKIVANVLLKKRNARYLTFSHLNMLRKFNPDIVILGGFSIPANFIAYLWARKNKKRTVVFTERSRDAKGNLRKRGTFWRIIKFAYRNVDLVLVSDADIVPQFRDEFRFGEKVLASRYASDIDDYFSHPVRSEKNSYNFLFPNRLIPIYSPLKAIQIFQEILSFSPGSKLFINAMGELRSNCEALIVKLGIAESVIFLDNINSWDELHTIYSKCDIMIFPADFSNGNFTIIEAMASGMGIVISNKILGVGKLIENGVNGFNIEPSNKTFIEAVKCYLNEPRLFVEHARINRKKVRPLGVVETAKDFSKLLVENLKLAEEVEKH